MELFNVPRNSRIKVIVEDKVPPGAPQIEEDEVAKDWWDSLSVEDYDTVTCCI